MSTDAEWESKLKSFLQRTGQDFRRAATDVKKEAERLMKEVQDPERQAKVREGVQEASVWARKTAQELASLVEVGVKQAEGALTEVAKQFKTAEPPPGARAPAPAPTPVNPAPPTVETAAPPPPAPKRPTKKSVGRGPKKPPTARPAGPKAKKPLGKAPTPPVDEHE
ncbi:MAG: transcriptional regulator [Myxococcaceae bacterium]|nr:transcriptional regulator [Myxococcaceae bacterium]